MDSTRNDNRLSYEPPRIYELEVDLTQARGSSLCQNGSHAGGTCNNGGNPSGKDCRGGGGVGSCSEECTTGSLPSGSGSCHPGGDTDPGGGGGWCPMGW